MDKQNVAYTYNGILPSFKKKEKERKKMQIYVITWMNIIF
jgi:hypothetical protein